MPCFFTVGEKIIPCATGKYLDVNTVDYQVFKMGRIQAYSSDALNRKMLEPSFEAIMDAGKIFDSTKSIKVESNDS